MYVWTIRDILKNHTIMISCCYKVILFFLCLMITETWSFWNTSSKVDCSVTPWSPWSSVNGQQTRMRRIMRHSQNGGEPCPSVSETKGTIFSDQICCLFYSVRCMLSSLKNLRVQDFKCSLLLCCSFYLIEILF
jgi:hypothetical protein